MKNINWDKLQEKLDKIKKKKIYEIVENKDKYLFSKKDKGSIGKIIEQYITEEKYSNKKESDLSIKKDNKIEKIELKTIGMKYIDLNKTKQLVAKERFVISMLNYENIVYQKTFKESDAYHKIKNILIVKYLYDYNDENFFNWVILDYKFIKLDDFLLKKIEHDYQILRNKVLEGKAHEISEKDTSILKACTKGTKSVANKKQPYSEIKAYSRAFSFKSSTITQILNNSFNIQQTNNFFDYIYNKLKNYLNWTINEIKKEFKITNSKNYKSIKDVCIKKILGINKYNEIDSFNDSYCLVRNIQIRNTNNKKKTNNLKEEIMLFSLDNTDYKPNQNFENACQESNFLDFVQNYRLVLIIWEQTDKNIFLKNVIHYDFNSQDIENAILVYKDTFDKVINKKVINQILTSQKTSSKQKYFLNFVSKKDNKTFHIRPKCLNNSATIITLKGECIPKQAYWLNKDVIEEILKKIK